MSYEQLIAICGPYLGIFLVLMACGLGLPLPEDVPLLTSGFLVHQNMAHLGLMIPVAMAGVLGGDCTLFFLGRRFGHHIVEHRIFRRVVNRSRLAMAERLFQRHGIKIIFVGRFLPGLRSMIFMAAGVLRVPFATFIGVNGLAACISVPTLVVLGKVFGDNLTAAEKEVRSVTKIIVVIILLGVLISVGLFFHRRQKHLIAEVHADAPVEAAGRESAPRSAEPGMNPCAGAKGDATDAGS